MASRSRVLSSTSAALPLLALLAACSSNSTVTKPGAPVPGTYAVDFPSIAAAVASKSVTIYVFNPSDSSAQCIGLLQAVNSGSLSNVAASAIQTISTSACELESPDGGALALPYGTYAVLVVTALSPGGAPFLYGCETPTISASSPDVAVEMRVVSNTTTIPTTNCTGLTPYCGHTCT